MTDKEEKVLFEVFPCPHCTKRNLKLTGMMHYTAPLQHEFKCACGATGWIGWSAIEGAPNRFVEVKQMAAPPKELLDLVKTMHDAAPEILANTRMTCACGWAGLVKDMVEKPSVRFCPSCGGAYGLVKDRTVQDKLDELHGTTRPTWHRYFMNLASHVASRSVCLRRQVGAVLVRDKQILTTGYNGPPSGIKHCAERGGCNRERDGVASGKRLDTCYALHAEMNAFLQAALHGVSTRGATLYCTTQPCELCAKMVIQAGVKRVIVAESYPDSFALALLGEADVPLQELQDAERMEDGRR